MHDSGPQLTSNTRQVIRMRKECVHQGSSGMPTRRVGDHARRFVHDEQRRILKQDVQRKILRPGLQRLRRGNPHLDLLPGLKPIGLSCYMTVDPHPTLRHEGLHTGPGEVQILRHVDIEPIPGMVDGKNLHPLLTLLQS